MLAAAQTYLRTKVIEAHAYIVTWFAGSPTYSTSRAIPTIEVPEVRTSVFFQY